MVYAVKLLVLCLGTAQLTTPRKNKEKPRKGAFFYGLIVGTVRAFPTRAKFRVLSAFCVYWYSCIGKPKNARNVPNLSPHGYIIPLAPTDPAQRAHNGRRSTTPPPTKRAHDQNHDPDNVARKSNVAKVASFSKSGKSGKSGKSAESESRQSRTKVESRKSRKSHESRLRVGVGRVDELHRVGRVG